MVTIADIEDFLAKHRITDKLTPETTIQSFRMVSEDLDDFFEDFSVRFNVDMTEYDYYDYFFEDVHPIFMMRDLFYRLFFPSKIKKKKITIEHLLRVANTKKWFKPTV